MTNKDNIFSIQTLWTLVDVPPPLVTVRWRQGGSSVSRGISVHRGVSLTEPPPDL